MLHNVRGALDEIYRRTRGLEQGLDPDVRLDELFGFAVRKISARVRGASRRHPQCYFGRRVEVRTANKLTLGKNVSIGDFVLIDCFGREGVLLGDGVTIDRVATLRASGVVRNLGVGIIVGDYTAIGAYNIVLGQGGVEIGRECLLGPHITVVSEDHRSDRRDHSIRSQGEERRSVIIGDDVWIGAGSTILKGSRIGHGAIVAAGAVVRGEVPDFAVVGGVPARKIGERGSRETGSDSLD